MRQSRKERPWSAACSLILVVGALIVSINKLQSQALLQIGERAPYTLQELVQPFARISGVDSVIALSKRHVAVRKAGETVFRLYTSQLRMVSSIPVNEIIAGDNGLLSFRFEEKWGLADTNGTLLIKPRFDDAGPFREGLVAFREGSCWGFMTRQGKWHIKPNFNCEIDGFRPEMSNGIAVIYDAGAGGWRYLSKDGKIINQRAYEYAYPFRFGHAYMGERDGMYLINKKAEIVLGPYDDAIPFAPAPVIPFVKNDFWGLLNLEKGEEIAAAVYSEISALHNGYAAVRSDKGWTIIDSTGQICRNDFFESLEFAEGKAFIFGNGPYDDRWLGLVDANCNVLLPAQWKWLGRFHFGIAVASKNMMHYEFIDEHGEPVLPSLHFSRSGNPAGGYINIIQENTQLIVDLKKQTVIKELEFGALETLQLFELN
jgi:hypothetical protein